ncbi:unnamed protein product [Lepidochelys olivacea]
MKNLYEGEPISSPLTTLLRNPQFYTTGSDPAATKLYLFLDGLTVQSSERSDELEAVLQDKPVTVMKYEQHSLQYGSY